MKRVMSAVLLASAVSLPAFENLDFEQIPPPPDPWNVTVPSWQHIGANGGGGGFWNVNGANLSGWAEAWVIYDSDPPLPGTIGFNPPPPIDGLFSMAFSAAWPLLPNQPTTNDYGSAWIAQTGTIEADTPWLTLITDYTGPHTEYYDYEENPDYFEVGYLTLYFDATPVGFTLEDAGTGSVGQPLRELRADLSAFAGQTGELRIGIEGPHTFVIDDIQLIPEPSSFSLLVGSIAALGVRKILRRPKSGES
jgi:hypothetical protein